MNKKLFVSHRQDHPQLRAFENALRELLHVEPVLLEDAPLIGTMPPNERSEHYMKTCDGILYLLTQDNQRGNIWQPSPSVAIEIPIGERIFPRNRQFCMLEWGTTFPPMAAPVTHIEFSWDGILPSMVTLKRALRAANFYQAIPPTAEPPTGATQGEYIFLLELLANTASSPLRVVELSALYQKKFLKDSADFMIVTDQMKRAELIEDGRVLMGGNGVSQAPILKIKSAGLQLLGKFRTLERDKKSVEMTAVLKKLGLIP